MIGQTISHYKILEKLGEGGMGVVYLAEDTKLERKVAIKFLPRHIATNKDECERFKIEAKAAAAINHPNIAHIYAIEEADDEMFIVMEYIDGQELKEKISKSPITIDEAIKIATQIAEGLQAAHSKEIVHRDIKSANVMITGDVKVKIMDFGLAKVRGGVHLTKEHSTLGTVAYMSPEQTRGEEVDQRTDIWSFGVVLYEMLLGELPFKGDYEQAIIYSILNEEINLSADLPQELNKICKKALVKNPDERYENFKQILDYLNDIKNEGGDQPVYSKSLLKRNKDKIKSILAISAVMVSILLITAIFYFDFFNASDGVVSSERKMLVVLPFANFGNEPEQEYFADGMTEEMITILGNANPKRLGVIARTSAMHYKRRDVTIENIGQELGVGYILEGSVRRQGEQVRIAAKLIQVEDQTLLWSKNFDSTMDNIFMLQSNVATQIAEALAVELLQGLHLTNRTHTPDPQAYEEYLTGRFFAHKGTEESWRKAINFYEEAVHIDPEFALAYAALSHAYSTWSTWNTILPKIAYDKSKIAADKAFRLSPNLADAHSALAVIAMFFEWNWQKAEEQFHLALELNPSEGDAYHEYGHYLSFLDRDDESIKAFKNALRLDPLSAYHRSCMGNAYLKKGEFGLAESSIKKALELAPETPLIYYTLGFLRERQDRLEEAILAWQKAVQYSNRLPQHLGALGYGYGKSGQTDKAHKILEELELKSRHGYVAASDISKIYAGLGDNDRAFAILEKTYTNREPWIFGLKVDPGFDTIRDDPRFSHLLRRIGVEP
jgi:serine/threonine protein kinase/Tfp pilus assembly protein PilF